MKEYITTYVNACQVCQQAKSEHTRLPGLLQPLPVPLEAWHTISLDFIEGLPKSKNVIQFWWSLTSSQSMGSLLLCHIHILLLQLHNSSWIPFTNSMGCP